MANVSKVKVTAGIYEIEDARTRNETSEIRTDISEIRTDISEINQAIDQIVSSGSNGTVNLSSPNTGMRVAVPSITIFGNPVNLENDAVTEINDLKTDVSELKSEISQAGMTAYVENSTLFLTTNVQDGNEVNY